MTQRELYQKACCCIRILHNKPTAINEFIARELLEEIYEESPYVWFAANASKPHRGCYEWECFSRYVSFVTLKTVREANKAYREENRDLG